MIAINVRRLSFISSLAGVSLLLFASVSHAALVFTGQDIDVSYSPAIGADITDSIIAGSGFDIAYNDGSTIGNSLMLDFEFIDFVDNAVTFQLRGDGLDYAGDASYNTTGLNGSYVLSLAGSGIFFDSVSIGSMSNITGVTMDSEITFDATNIFFDVSTLGILEVTPGADLGTITLDVQFVPIPAALPLMLSGLTGLLLFSRRRKSV